MPVPRAGRAHVPARREGVPDLGVQMSRSMLEWPGRKQRIARTRSLPGVCPMAAGEARSTKLCIVIRKITFLDGNVDLLWGRSFHQTIQQLSADFGQHCLGENSIHHPAAALELSATAGDE